MVESEPDRKPSNSPDQSKVVSQRAPLPNEEALPVLAEMEAQIGDALQKELQQIIPSQKAGEVSRFIRQAVSNTFNNISHRNTFIVLPGDEDHGLKPDQAYELMKAEQEQRHRWDNRNAWFQYTYAMTSITFGLVASLALIYGAIELGMVGQKEVAIALTTASAVGIVYAFVKGATLFNPKRPSSTEVAEQKKPPPRKRKN
jgi:hypothetical protein